MSRPGRSKRKYQINSAKLAIVAVPWLIASCNRAAPNRVLEQSDVARTGTLVAPSSTAPPAASRHPEPAGVRPPPATNVLSQVPAPPGTPVISNTPDGPQKVDFQDTAMGTNVHFIAYTNEHVDTARIQS